MKYLFIFAACMMLDAIVPKSCQSEEYRQRYENWPTDENDSSHISSTADDAPEGVLPDSL